jgi:hypothetical protein
MVSENLELKDVQKVLILPWIASYSPSAQTEEGFITRQASFDCISQIKSYHKIYFKQSSISKNI